MFDGMTTVEQGRVGLGMAVAHYTKQRAVVSLPLIDNQSYDLVVDDGNKLSRVEVKTTRFKEKENSCYTVQLRKVRHNKTENKKTHFDAKSADILFVVTETGDQYVIPASEVDGKASYCLGDKAARWKV
jgi:hypothetical protein